MLRNSLILILGVVLLLRLPSVDFSAEVENSLQISVPAIENFRETLITKGNNLLPDPQSGLLLGMVIGAKNEISYNFNQLLKKTGVVHVVVVSGQNLTLLAGFILGFATILGRKKTIILSMIVVTFYVFLTGFQIPVIRAAIMFGLSSAGKLFGREGDAIRILLATALAMLIINPLWITSISFQLSFAATIGVVVVAPKLMKVGKFVPEGLKEGLIVTFAAQILTAPIIAYHFQQFSLAGFFVNALVLWTIPYIMISGAFVLLISLISTNLASILIFFPSILLTYFVDVVQLFNKPWASSYVDQFSIIQLVGIYTLIIGGYLLIKNKTKDEEEVTNMI